MLLQANIFGENNPRNKTQTPEMRTAVANLKITNLVTNKQQASKEIDHYYNGLKSVIQLRRVFWEIPSTP